MLLFETIRVLHGEPKHLEFHQKRIQNSLGFAPKFELETLIKTDSPKLQKAKLIYSGDGEFVKLEMTPYTKRDIKSFKLVLSDMKYEKKYLDRSRIDELFSKKGKADEILITQNSLLKDTSIHNIALLIEDRWLTPAHPLLRGTTRERLLAEGKISESELSIEDLKRCSKIALLNAMVGFYVVDEFRIL
jgi:4-amino-4-deoxychorismate lyase